jgi:hypothetical protein
VSEETGSLAVVVNLGPEGKYIFEFNFSFPIYNFNTTTKVVSALSRELYIFSKLIASTQIYE